ncbi:MAG: hypothetical protein A2X56_04270 [Nitrospirae bacterium GWC2_57_13]|jgi:rhodanese-related sulfurtransferase|nr:MAG: hypothetical protein A2072_06180 [Nitrospirae bacterium GWC1_57_7]OGW26667.1 MAG: hypothetical protein A2X56_04270 [Nitrospirae bacterium GWC2_57_13]OGW40834.1 MAG: hypothetical protein A2X57_04655 [Nitrospirae bacterium GWD2_57_8]HAR39712.1 hypothetical protein [Porphyromonadaceae bacterium]HAS54232.1 hypothetical protein [Nitrospiraceae bacterium]
MKKSIVLTICFAILVSFAAVMPAVAFESVSTTQAYDLVMNGSTAAMAYDSATVYYIVDVRTPEEWRWVGHPGMNKAGIGNGLDLKVFNVAYMIDWKKQFVVNPSFVSEINGLFGSVKENVVLIFMCRSGQRGAAAASLLEPLGYRVMNMVNGFQGSTDANGYRVRNGWVNDGFPYNYNAAGAYAD